MQGFNLPSLFPPMLSRNDQPSILFLPIFSFQKDRVSLIVRLWKESMLFGGFQRLLIKSEFRARIFVIVFVWRLSETFGLLKQNIFNTLYLIMYSQNQEANGTPLDLFFIALLLYTIARHCGSGSYLYSKRPVSNITLYSFCKEKVVDNMSAPSAPPLSPPQIGSNPLVSDQNLGDNQEQPLTGEIDEQGQVDTGNESKGEPEDVDEVALAELLTSHEW